MALRLSKNAMNMAYGLGASIVIIGALMKIIHQDLNLGLFSISGNDMLTIGLVTEAIIFALFAFDPPGEDLDWSLVYPELEGGVSSAKKESPQGLLTKKLDVMLAEAKVDVRLMSSLTNSIKDFEASAKSGADSADS